MNRWIALPALVVAVVAASACLPSHQAGIVINFAMYPEEFEGLEVEIDGEVAGRLERFGAQTTTKFLVPRGDHLVRVLHPEMDCPPRKVTADNRAMAVHLMLDIMETVDEDGRYRSLLTLDG